MRPQMRNHKLHLVRIQILIVTWFSHLAAAPIASWYEFERLEFSSKSLSISVDCESIFQQDDKPTTLSDGIYTENYKVKF